MRKSILAVDPVGGLQTGSNPARQEEEEELLLSSGTGSFRGKRRLEQHLDLGCFALTSTRPKMPVLKLCRDWHGLLNESSTLITLKSFGC